MLAPHYTEAWIHEVHSVLGRCLLPYCTWHCFALKAIESPFLSGTGSPNIGDLEVAVRICRSRYDASGQRSMADLIGVSGLTRLRLILRVRRHDAVREAAGFIRYIRDYQSFPQFWQQGSPSETSGAPPDELSVVARLMAAGIPETRAWMMPIGQAHWYAATLARQAGADLRFVSESTGFLHNIAALKAQYQAAKKARSVHA